MTIAPLSDFFAPIRRLFYPSRETQKRVWQPSNIFATNKTLRLQPTDLLKIHSKMHHPVEICDPVTGKSQDFYYVDAVFEGGGVKGTAFLGALQCLHDAGIRLRKVAGTSAGAITAAMVATGFNASGEFEMKRLEKCLSELDYKSLLSRKSSPFIFNGDPSNDLQNPVLMLLNLLLVGRKGQYSSAPFLTWLQQQISPDKSTFKYFEDKAGKPWYEQRELRVVISDISQKAMRVLPTDLKQHYDGIASDSFLIAEAVRLSMSIPFFFEPGELGQSTIVDGGVLSNFPLWIYDVKSNQIPKCPTFGFQLVEKPQSTPIAGAVPLFTEMLNTMQEAGDRHYVEKNNQGRVIDIDLSKLGDLQVTATQFDLTNEQKDALYKLGYEATKEFLLHQWDWQQHLKARGYDANAAEQMPGMVRQEVQRPVAIAA